MWDIIYGDRIIALFLSPLVRHLQPNITDNAIQRVMVNSPDSQLAQFFTNSPKVKSPKSLPTRPKYVIDPQSKTTQVDQ